MKKVMFLVMVAVMPFISCSSDDDSSNGGQDAIVGKWRESKFTEKYYEDDVLRDTVVSLPTSTDYYEVEFKADRTFTNLESDSYINENGEEIVETISGGGTYEIKGDSIILIYLDEESEAGETYSENAKFSISENILTFHTSDERTEQVVVFRGEYEIEYTRQ